MAHTSRCSGARTDRCNCCCCHLLHGGSLGSGMSWAGSRSSSLVGSPGRGGTHRRVSGRRRTAMGKATDEIKGWLTGVAADPPSTVAAATSQAVDALCDKVASAIVNTLHRKGPRWSDADHVLCDFLAAAAHAMEKFRDQFQHYVEHIVATVLASRRGQKRQAIPEPVARVAAQAAVNALMKLTPAREFDDLLRAMRILAVATCPAPEQHRSVAIYCLAPLETGVLSSAMKQELTRALPPGWMGSSL
jgi:hypothetical protein